MGYDASLTSKTGDFGADIIAKKDKDTVVIEVKKYDKNNKVGAGEIQEFLGSMWIYNAQKAIFITTSDFTNHAKAQATNAPIELWNDRKLHKLFLDYY